MGQGGTFKILLMNEISDAFLFAALMLLCWELGLIKTYMMGKEWISHRYTYFIKWLMVNSCFNGQ